MTCWKCGKEMGDGARFCPHCGSMVAGGEPVGQDAAPVGQAPANPDGGPAGKKRKGGALAIAGVTAVLAVVIAVAAAFAGGLFASPKGKVEKALVKTMAAYADAANSVGLPDWSGLSKARAFTRRVSFTLDSIAPELSSGYDLSSLKGIGLRAGTDCDREDRKLDAVVTLFYGGEDLASLRMLADDQKLFFASPEFTGDAAYGMDTTTLGWDLSRLGVEDDTVDIAKISFNLFDLMEKAALTDAETEEMERTLREAGEQMAEAITVQKGGKEDIRVNGRSVSAERYHVVVPEDAVRNCIRAVENVVTKLDTTDRVRDMLRSMGLDADLAGELMSRMDGTDVCGELTGKLRQWEDGADDVELDVYLSDGYLCAAEYSGLIENTGTEVKLQLGGGESYTDDLSLAITANGSTLSVVSMAGRLAASRDSVELKLDELSVKAAGSTLLSLKTECYLGPFEGMKVSMPNQTLLGDMDRDGLTEMMKDIQGNAVRWALSVINKLPADLLMSLFW